jgi:SAM-dependent methyltransferase
MPEFLKYRQFGAYHWDNFEQGGIYKDHVLKVIDWIKEKKVLDIGCGDGLITSKIGAKGIDTDEEGIRLAQEKGVSCEVLSAYDVKGKYDAVFLGDTLEHLEYPDQAIEAIGKITDTLYIVVPTESDADDFTKWNHTQLRVFMMNHGWNEESTETTNFRIYGKYTKIDDSVHILRPKRKVARNTKRKAPANKGDNSGRPRKRATRKVKRN